MKVPVPMIGAGGAGGVVAGILLLALAAFALRQALKGQPAGQPPQR